MTTNQIILLLEIRRGTPELQSSIGTVSKDIKYLEEREFITNDKMRFILTKAGENLCDIIIKITNL